MHKLGAVDNLGKLYTMRLKKFDSIIKGMRCFTNQCMSLLTAIVVRKKLIFALILITDLLLQTPKKIKGLKVD